MWLPVCGQEGCEGLTSPPRVPQPQDVDVGLLVKELLLWLLHLPFPLVHSPQGVGGEAVPALPCSQEAAGVVPVRCLDTDTVSLLNVKSFWVVSPLWLPRSWRSGGAG